MSQKYIQLSHIVTSNISNKHNIFIINVINVINVTIITNVTNVITILIYIFLKNNYFLIKLKEDHLK